MSEDADGNLRSLDNLVMDGSAVFNFVQVEVPPMIEEILHTADKKVEDVDVFLFHQPNRFMLEKLASRIGVPLDKMPTNVVEHFGNSSGVTIPIALAFNLSEKITSEGLYACLSGFGVGLTWSSMLMRLGPMQFCDMITF